MSTSPPCRRATWATSARPTPRAGLGGALGGPAALERVRPASSSEARAAVPDRDDELAVASAEGDPDRRAPIGAAATASKALSTRLPSTVTRSRDPTSTSGKAPSTTKVDAALGGLRRLAEQQGRHDRVAHGADHPVGEQLGELELLGGELDRLVGPAHLDQRHHGVQPVGGLVVLGAQRLGQAADHVELAGDRLQLGVVAQGDHGTDVAALPSSRRRADHEHPVAREVDVVGLGGPSQSGGAPGRAAGRGRREAGRPRRSAGRAAGWPRR